MERCPLHVDGKQTAQQPRPRRDRGAASHGLACRRRRRRRGAAGTREHPCIAAFRHGSGHSGSPRPHRCADRARELRAPSASVPQARPAPRGRPRCHARAVRRLSDDLSDELSSVAPVRDGRQKLGGATTRRSCCRTRPQCGGAIRTPAGAPAGRHGARGSYRGEQAAAAAGPAVGAGVEAVCDNESAVMLSVPAYGRRTRGSVQPEAQGRGPASTVRRV